MVLELTFAHDAAFLWLFTKLQPSILFILQWLQWDFMAACLMQTWHSFCLNCWSQEVSVFETQSLFFSVLIALYLCVCEISNRKRIWSRKHVCFMFGISWTVKVQRFFFAIYRFLWGYRWKVSHYIIKYAKFEWKCGMLNDFLFWGCHSGNESSSDSEAILK